MEDHQSLTDALNARFESADRDTSPETPQATEASAPESPAPSESEPAADTAPDATGEEEPLWNRAEFLQQHPELQPLAKQLQADYTRKMQAIAEQRKALEGVDTAAVQWLRQFNEALATNPQQARAMLEQEQARLFGTGPQTPAYEEPEEDLYVTEAERQHARDIAALKAQLAQMQQRSELAEVQARMHQQFDVLEKEAGVSLPQEQRLSIIEQMARAGVPYTQVGTFWWGTAGRDRLLQQGREEGLRLAQQKAALGAPPSAQVSAEPRDEPEPATLLEALKRKGLG